MIVVFIGKATVIRIVKQLLRRIKREFLLPLCKVKMKTHHKHRDRVIEQKRTDDGARPAQGGGRRGVSQVRQTLCRVGSSARSPQGHLTKTSYNDATVMLSFTRTIAFTVDFHRT